MFDVFLSHNSKDKEQVEDLARRLEDDEKLKPWLDKWNLVPGEPWQEALEEALDQSRTCAVFIGPGAIGPWHNEEMRVALDRRVREHRFRVIPVLLPGAKLPDRGELPTFLTRLTWVDFRRGLDDEDAFHLFVCGITGKPPGRRVGEPALITAIECPYRGLEVFNEAHTRFFFRREAMTQHLIESLRPVRFLFVIGSSGSGKSSIARAGLLPKLRANALPGSVRWTYFIFKPGPHPLEELAIRLTQTGRNRDSVALLKSLGSDERALHLEVRLQLMERRASGALTEERYSTARYFFLIDQFEELFTTCTNEDERILFIRNLRYAGTVDGGESVIVVTMRADFFQHAAKYSELAELLSSHQFIVSPMDQSELKRAIEEPASAVGLRFENGLIERVLRDVGQESGALPLMEHALLELYENRRGEVLTQQAYEESGGVQGALAGRAEAILNELSDRQDIIRQIMLRLTQPGEGTEDTRRRAMKSELLTSNQDQAAIEKVLERFTSARLLTTDIGVGGDVWVDIAHEALIRGWPSLRKWIDEDREGLRIHKRLTDDAREWHKQDRNESFVYYSVRLAQALEWRRSNESALNSLEREFLDAGDAIEKRKESEERERQERELEAMRQLAENEKQRAKTEESARKRQRLFLIGLTLLLILAGLVAVYARRQQQKAEDSERRNKYFFYAASMNLARNDFDSGNRKRGYELLDTFLPVPPESRSEDLRSFYWYYLWKLHHKELASLTGLKTPVNSVAFSPDGLTLASSGFKELKLWDVRSGKELTSFTGFKDPVDSVAFSPDGLTLASGSGNFEIGELKLWDVRSGKQLGLLKGLKGDIRSVAFSPDGLTLASGSAGGELKLWDMRIGQQMASLLSLKGDVNSVAFSPDGRTLAIGGGVDDGDSENGYGELKLWDVRNGKELASFTGLKTPIISVAFSPDGLTLANCSKGGELTLWDVRNGKQVSRAVLEGSFKNVTFSPDGQILATGGGVYGGGTEYDYGELKLWDVRSGKELISFTGLKGAVRSAAFSPDGLTLASGGINGELKLWDVRNGKELASLTGLKNPVLSVAFSPDGLTLASGGGETYRNGELRLWDVRRGKELASFLSLQGDVVSVAFSPDGLTLATSIFNKYGDDLRLWDLRTGQQLGSLTNPYDHVDSVAFSPDGRTLASIVINYSRINFSIRNPYRLRLYFAATHEEVARQRDN